MKILFITSGSIGDAVISTGLMAHLMAVHPQAKFTIATGPAASSLFESFPQLERVIVIRKQKRKKHWFALWQAVRRERWDLVVDLRSSMLSFLLRAKQRKIFRRANQSVPKLDQLGALFGLHPAPTPVLWVSEEAARQAAALLPQTPVIVMVPISNSPYKDWPIERFAELGKRLLAMPEFSAATLAVIGLENQRPSLLPLLSALPPARILDLIGKTTLPLACAILQRAQLVIGNDSGLLHIAGALGTKLVGLYGPTNDLKYAPRGPHVRIAKVREFQPADEEIKDAEIIRQLSVEQVEAKVQELLGGK